MMTKPWQILAFLLLLSLTWSGCGQGEPPKPKETTKGQLQKQAGELLDSARQYLQQQKDKLLQEFNGRMQGLDQKIKELQDRAEKATPETKARLEGLIKDLQDKQAAIKKQLQESQEAVGQAWEELKSGLNRQLKELEQETAKGRES